MHARTPAGRFQETMFAVWRTYAFRDNAQQTVVSFHRAEDAPLYLTPQEAL